MNVQLNDNDTVMSLTVWYGTITLIRFQKMGITNSRISERATPMVCTTTAMSVIEGSESTQFGEKAIESKQRKEV